MPQTLPAYPPMPLNANRAVIKPSKRFKMQAFSMICALLLFVVTYLLLLLAALAIAAGFLFLAYCLVVLLHFNTLTLGLAIALVASGGLLVYFLIKFIFKKSTPEDNADLIEVHDADHPLLFDFIRNVTRETGVPFPKHIYLSQDVNAGVFFDSSFWSMFLPVKKNLKIGLGLVNSLNRSEFKAVMAHEFGHFSQRSMKFGSYVYNLNKVIHDLLYDNEGYRDTLGYWSNAHSIFRFTAFININLIKGIQLVLQKVYVIINKSHLRLSREMEFQADAIAAYVGGSNQSINCLRRIDVAQVCYQDLLNYWNSKLSNKQRTQNLYDQHLEMMRYYAQDHRLKLDALGMPLVDRSITELNHTRVSLNDQWASHPTEAERERHLQALNIDTDAIESSTWSLFNDPEKLQQQATDLLYAQFEVEGFEAIDNEQFKAMYMADMRSNSFDPYYKSYYDGRYIEIQQLTPDEIGNVTIADIDALFCDEYCDLPRKINGIQTDMDLLNYAKTTDNITSFDLGGTKYTIDKADTIIDQLTADLEKAQQELKALDQRIYNAFYSMAVGKGHHEQLVQKYQALIALQERYTDAVEFYGKLRGEIAPCYGTMKFEDIHNTLARVRVTEEELKTRLNSITLLSNYTSTVTAQQQEAIQKYLSADWEYFDGRSYNNENLELLMNTTDAYLQFFYRDLYNLKDQLLTFKLDMLINN